MVEEEPCVYAACFLSAPQELVPITEEVPVPFDYHRFIIGGKGKDVRKMMQDYDVNISIPHPSENSDLVKVSGPPENVERARKALQDKVTQLDAEKEDRVRALGCRGFGFGVYNNQG